MSTSTLSPTAQGSPDDFDAWEHELSPTFRPTRAAERREAREVIARELGIRRHRTREREA